MGSIRRGKEEYQLKFKKVLSQCIQKRWLCSVQERVELPQRPRRCLIRADIESVHLTAAEKKTQSVLRVCQFTSLVVFFWRLLISAECSLQFHCQLWWKERENGQEKRWDRERDRGYKAKTWAAAKSKEFVMGLERDPTCPCGVWSLVALMASDPVQ